jgi:hypothetical protein
MRKITAGANNPELRMTLQDANGAINLTTSSSITITIEDDTKTTTLVADGAMAYETDGSDGRVSYAWSTSLTDATPGVYLFKVTVNWSDGSVTKFPDDGFGRFEITADF